MAAALSTTLLRVLTANMENNTKKPLADFGVTRTAPGKSTIASVLADKAAGALAPAAGSLTQQHITDYNKANLGLSTIDNVENTFKPTPIYFRAYVSHTNLITDKGRIFTFGIPTPYWHVTDNEEEIDYIRRNFCGKTPSETSFPVQEMDKYTLDASTIIQPEILPLPNQE